MLKIKHVPDNISNPYFVECIRPDMSPYTCQTHPKLQFRSTKEDLKQMFEELKPHVIESTHEDIYDEIKAERVKQNKKWGEQTHNPLGWFVILGEELGEAAEDIVNMINGIPDSDHPLLWIPIVLNDFGRWCKDILDNRFEKSHFASFEMEAIPGYRGELIQVLAVVVRMIEVYDEGLQKAVSLSSEDQPTEHIRKPIFDEAVVCPICNWEGTVRGCELDADGYGNFGCPICMNEVEVKKP